MKIAARMLPALLLNAVEPVYEGMVLKSLKIFSDFGKITVYSADGEIRARFKDREITVRNALEPELAEKVSAELNGNAVGSLYGALLRIARNFA